MNREYFDDEKAKRFFQLMLDEKLSREEFDHAVETHLIQNNMVVRAPETAAWILQLTRGYGNDHDAGYARQQHGSRFTSQWLVGKPGIPGGVHIIAPGELRQSPGLMNLNRPPHLHDTSRIGLITSGHAVFIYIEQHKNGNLLSVHCDVRAGDMIFWPAGTPHTFNAMQGFSLLSAMPDYVSPENDGFSIPTTYTREQLNNARIISRERYFR